MSSLLGKKSGKSKQRLDAECYHAGMSAAQRKRVQKAFMSGRLWIVVATVAFGKYSNLLLHYFIFFIRC